MSHTSEIFYCFPACLYVCRAGTVDGMGAKNSEPEMVEVAGGSFTMGDMFGDGREDETPHTVRVDSFLMAKYEVTQDLWVAVMGTNPSWNQAYCRCPVTDVSWHDVQIFLQKINKLTGKHYRLPTEAEWEYAARSGGKKEKWPGTNDMAQRDEYLWSCWTFSLSCFKVGQLKPNGLGLYDMAGSVCEWCQDWYAADYYQHSPLHNPKGPAHGQRRVCRGGKAEPSVRTAARDSQDPAKGETYNGFRLAISGNPQ